MVFPCAVASPDLCPIEEHSSDLPELPDHSAVILRVELQETQIPENAVLLNVQPRLHILKRAWPSLPEILQDRKPGNFIFHCSGIS